MLKLGIVGLRVGRAFFDVVRQFPGVELKSLCDIDEACLLAAGTAEPAARIFRHFDDMLASDIDAVVIATPIQVHGVQALAAMRAGKHVLCQYIAAMDPEEADDLVRVATAMKTTYMFIETDCYERRNLVMAELARRGLLGDLTMGRGHYIHDCKTMGRNRDGSLTWRGELWMESPGGRVSAVHNAMPLLEVFGERVTEVFSYGPGSRTQPEFRKHDRVTTVCRLPSGRIIELVDDVLSWHPLSCGYCLQGTRGCFEFDRAALVTAGGLSDWKDLDALELEYGLGISTRDHGGHQSAWTACLEQFGAAVEGGTRPPQDLFDALHITAIGWAANESLSTGQPAKVPRFDP